MHWLIISVTSYCFQSVCDRLCGRYDIDENQDVEVIVETVAVVDNSNYAECDLEGGKVTFCQQSNVMHETYFGVIYVNAFELFQGLFHPLYLA